MGIQRKITITYFLCFFVMMVLGYYFFSMVMFQDLNILEKEICRHKLDAGYAFLRNESKRIQRTLQDYSSWSQTCDFIKAPNETYRNENLQADVLDYLDISFIAILDDEGHWVEGVYNDSRTKSLQSFPDDVKSFITNYRSRWLSMNKKNEAINGFVQISNSVFLLAASPVTKEKREGPVAGYMFMGLKLSLQKLKTFSSIIEEDMIISPRTLCPGVGEYCFSRRGDNIFVCRPIIDIFNRPTQRLGMTISRNVFAFAVKANRQFLFWYIVSSLVVFLVVVFVFESVVVRPIRRANSQLSQVIKNNLPMEKSDVPPGKDEEQFVSLINKTSLTTELLKKVSETNRKFIEDAPMGIIVVDEKMKIQDLNRRSLDISGYSSVEDLKYKDSSVLFYQNRYVQADKDQSVTEFSYYLRKKCGDVIPVTATRSSLQLDGREMTLIGFVDQSEAVEMKVVAADYKNRYEDLQKEFQRVDQALKSEINQHRGTQAELIKVREEAQTYNSLRYAVLSNLSHAMKTPLNGLIGFSDLINDDSLPTEVLRNNLKIISQCSSQLLEVVNEVMDMSQLESGDVKPVYEIVNVNMLMTGIYDHWAGKVKDDIDFVLLLPSDQDDLKIAIDREWFMKAMQQLLANAFKFTESGKVELGYRMEDNVPCFMVSDTGIGMTEEVRALSQEMFYQAENVLHRHYEGLGLGLSIVQRIVKMMNGVMRIDSSINKGTTVYLTFNLSGNDAKNDYYVV